MSGVQSGFSLTERRAIETDGRGNVRYKIYGQDGTFTDMLCEDTPSNRMFVLWLRQFDRYCGKGAA